MWIFPKDVSRFDIPLCRMLYMPLVRPILAIDIKRLETELPMDIALVHLFSMSPSIMRRGRNGLLQMRIKVVGALTGPQLMRNLKLSRIQILIFNSSLVECSMFVIEIIGSRLG